MDRDYLLQKWLNGNLTDEEKAMFEQLEDYQGNLDIIEHAKHFKASHFSNVDNFEDFKTRYKAQNKPAKTLQWMHPFLRIASILVIAFGVYFTFFYNNLTEINTLASQKATIELPDQSQVILNAVSDLSFSSRRWNTSRSVELDGEAYFKVAKGKTFDVITETGTVTVVGTEFNVKHRDQYFEVKCFEGVVKVSADTIVRQLVAGDTYRIIHGNFTIGKTTSSKPQWINNRSSFNGVTFNEVIEELKRQYNIDILVSNKHLQRLFTGGFVHDDLDKALISITQPMDLTYKMNTSNQVVIHDKKE